MPDYEYSRNILYFLSTLTKKDIIAPEYIAKNHGGSDIRPLPPPEPDPWNYDLVDRKEYKEIDILYTSDVHGAWVGYDMDGNYTTPKFSYRDVGAYRDQLAKNKIKALIVDAGDWSRPCRSYNDYLKSKVMQPAIEMRNQKYFLATYGNHEWRWSTHGEANTESILNMCNCMTACNLFKNGKLLYKPYRTAKIGSKRIATIGIGYPSANGEESHSGNIWTYGSYTFYDGARLFSEVQKYIDELKANKFDYIIAVCHMCKSSYEGDDRYTARTDTLIKNTSGLTAVIQGHHNWPKEGEIIKDKSSKNVLLASESGANLSSFGRLKITDTSISSYLIDDRSDLNII